MLFNYRFRNYNIRLVFYTLLLSILGVLFIRSATGRDPAYVNKQLMGIMAGFTTAAILSLIDYHRIMKASWAVYGGCLGILLAVLLFGKNVNHATRWLILPGIGQIQPSEFVKIGLIVFFAWFFGKSQERINSLRTLLTAGGLFAVVFLMIVREPDLSTGLVAAVVFACMLYAAGISYRWIATAAAIMVPCGILFIYLLQRNMMPFLRGYQAMRILAFVNREKYAEVNLQQDNSIMAIGSGMLRGKGLNNNTLASVKNGNFLSEEQTDFIFAVIGEESGFIGSMAVLALIVLIVAECLIVGSHARDMYGRLLCVGIATLLAFQSFANIAVATGVLPNTGLPLPFISYGVSSLLSIYIGIGLTLNVGLQKGAAP